MHEGNNTGTPPARAAGWMRFATYGALLVVGLVGGAQYASSESRLQGVTLADTSQQLQLALPSGSQSITTAAADARVEATGAEDKALLTAAMLVAPTEPELSPEMMRVRDWVSKRYRVSSSALVPVLAQAEDSAREAGLDPLLIVAMMAIESSFNPYAESQMGAQGLMQVIPRFHMDKIGKDAGANALFDPVLNVHVGTLVLAEGMQRFGSLQAALQYYGGARNDPNAAYSKKVLAMKRKIASAARVEDA